MTTSESPTHPDAPRAGGETPDTIEICGHRFTRNVAFTAEYPNQRWLRLAADGNYRYAGADEWLDRIYALQREVAELRASLLERHRDGEWESANAADLTGARWYCEHCDAWGTVEIVRLPQLDAENLVCLKCRYQVAAFVPASAPPSPERASPPQHVCGLSGFGRGVDGLNDRCPACEARV